MGEGEDVKNEEEVQGWRNVVIEGGEEGGREEN